MKFTVLWSSNAEAKLARLWFASNSRQAIADASDKIDISLSTSADTAGESRLSSRRIVHESPLGVLYSVDIDDRKVLVLDVWQYDIHNQ
jgi:hypothetical protein